jgi:hypothetical protein
MAVNGYAAAQDVAELKVSTAALAVAMGERVAGNETAIELAQGALEGIPDQFEEIENSVQTKLNRDGDNAQPGLMAAIGEQASDLTAMPAPIVDSDILTGYRSGLKRFTASTFADYIKAFFSASGGSALVGFLQDGAGAVARTAQAKMRDLVSVKDFGAIGDGTSHPVSEWIPSRFANLAAVQAEYPDVTATTDQIDFAAINAALRYAVANTKGIFIPAGLYLAWVKAWYSNVCIVGAGSVCTTIRVPNGATHTIPENVNPGPPFVTGVPCVVDFNCIGHGNEAVAMTNGHISGLTLDGNASGTTTPSYDLFGWGLSFTAYSNVTYDDMVVINTHCGGVGTFINSNFHSGSARVKNCGNSLVDSAYRPGFDVNSSKYSHWEIISEDCAYGARLLDNCYNNFINVVAKSPTISGFIFNNQMVNSSYGNNISVTVANGCTDWAFVMGANCFENDIAVFSTGIIGGGYTDIAYGSGGIYDSRGNRVQITSRMSQLQSALVNSSGNDFDIVSYRDGLIGGVGAMYAFDVYGNNNRFTLRHQDSPSWKARGLTFRTGAAGNRVVSYIWDTTLDPYTDVDGANFFLRTYKGQKTYDPGSIADNAIETTNVTVVGAVKGMYSQGAFSDSVFGLLITSEVVNTDTVNVRFENKTGGTVDLPSGTLKATAWSE